MKKFVPCDKENSVIRCSGCKGLVIFDKDGLNNESVGGLVRQYVDCPECKGKTYLYAWNVLR